MGETRIIVVEDEALIRMDVRETLAELGYRVVGEARDGLSAVNLARALQPDLVLMDIQLPQLDGLAAARILWEERIAPVLILTAYTDHDLVARARTCGIAGYLVKPFRADTLGPAIEVALARFADLRERDAGVQAFKRELATHKLVAQAKGVLMAQYRLSEPEAVRRIEQLATQTEQSVHAVAEAVLLAKELRS